MGLGGAAWYPKCTLVIGGSRLDRRLLCPNRARVGAIPRLQGKLGTTLAKRFGFAADNVDFVRVHTLVHPPTTTRPQVCDARSVNRAAVNETGYSITDAMQQNAVGNQLILQGLKDEAGACILQCQKSCEAPSRSVGARQLA